MQEDFITLWIFKQNLSASYQHNIKLQIWHMTILKVDHIEVQSLPDWWDKKGAYFKETETETRQP